MAYLGGAVIALGLMLAFAWPFTRFMRTHGVNFYIAPPQSSHPATHDGMARADQQMLLQDRRFKRLFPVGIALAIVGILLTVFAS